MQANITIPFSAAVNSTPQALKWWEFILYSFSIALLANVGLSLFIDDLDAGYSAPLDNHYPLFKFVSRTVLVLSALVSCWHSLTLYQLILRAWPISAACAVVGLSSLWSLEPVETLSRFALLLVSVVLAGGMVSKHGISSLGSIFRFIGWTMVIANVVLLILEPSFAYNQSEYAGVFRGLFPNKNTLGQFSLCVILFTIPTFFRRNLLPNHVMNFALLACMVATILICQSATALMTAALALFCGIVFWLVQNFQFGFAYRVVFLIVALVVSIVAIWLGQDEVLSLIGRTSTLTGRSELWELTWQAVLERPILGFGFRVFWESDQGAALRFGDAWTPSTAHNGYLENLLSGGVVLLGLSIAHVLSLLQYAITRLLKHISEASALVLMPAIALPVFNIAESVFIKENSAPTFLLVAALLTAYQMRGFDAHGR